MTNLYVCAFESITLAEAIKQCTGYLDDAVGLFYSPQCCHFGKFQADKTVTGHNSTDEIPLDKVFEARIFSESKAAELRWLNEFNGNGKAVLICEQQLNEQLLAQTLDPLENLDTIYQTYILWGEGTKTNIGEGWSRLATARIGKLDVPLANVNHLDRVLLRTREYIDVVDNYGNVAVVEERLIALKREKDIIFQQDKSDDKNL